VQITNTIGKYSEVVWVITDSSNRLFQEKYIHTIHGIIKKAEPNDPAFQGEKSLIGCNDRFDYLFLNFFLNPANPIKPEPKSIKVAGSGTGVIGSPEILTESIPITSL